MKYISFLWLLLIKPEWNPSMKGHTSHSHHINIDKRSDFYVATAKHQNTEWIFQDEQNPMKVVVFPASDLWKQGLIAISKRQNTN